MTSLAYNSACRSRWPVLTGRVHGYPNTRVPVNTTIVYRAFGLKCMSRAAVLCFSLQDQLNASTKVGQKAPNPFSYRQIKIFIDIFVAFSACGAYTTLRPHSRKG